MLKAPALPSQIPAFEGSPVRASVVLSGDSDLLLHAVLAMTGDRAVEVVAAGLELDRHCRVGAGLDVLGCLGRTGALDVQVVDYRSLVGGDERVRAGREGGLRQLDLVLDLRHGDLLALGGRALRLPAEDEYRRDHRHDKEQRAHVARQNPTAAGELRATAASKNG